MLEKLAPASSPAQGRLDYGPPVAVIDIGSNSVRLVVYERLTRAPTALFNEKALCGLGRGLNDDGTLVDDAKYELSQARIAYEQALRLDPEAAAARFNLSVLLSILPSGLLPREKQPSDMALSNLPIGLP